MNILVTQGRPEHPITSYPRFGALRLVRSARRELAGEQNQADTSAPTNRIAAGSLQSLKSVGRRGYGNVIGNSCVRLIRFRRAYEVSI